MRAPREVVEAVMSGCHLVTRTYSLMGSATPPVEWLECRGHGLRCSDLGICPAAAEIADAAWKASLNAAAERLTAEFGVTNRSTSRLRRWAKEDQP